MLAQDPRVTRERIERFKRLGGIDLSHLEPEEVDPLLALVQTGTAHLKRVIFAFRCEMCGNVARSDSEMEPLCTGPSPSLDEHPPVVMTPFR